MTGLAFDRAGMFDATELDGLKRAGAIAVCGYIVGTPGGMAHIDKAHVDLILSKGLGFVPNWERKADYLVSCGKAGGFAAGMEALAACRALGVPDDGTVAVVFSWDTFVGPSLYPQCGEVADGIIQGLGGRYLFSAYGQGGLLDFLAQTGRMKPGVKGWLSMSEAFPGFWVGSPPKMNSLNVAMVQEHHADGSWYTSPVPGTDVNTILNPAALHAWWPDNSPYGDNMQPQDVWNFIIESSTGGRQTAAQRLIEAETNVAALVAQVKALQARLDKLSSDGVVAPTHFTGTVDFKAAP